MRRSRAPKIASTRRMLTGCLFAFCDACDNPLFFRDVNGIPVDWKNALEEDILRNMSGPLAMFKSYRSRCSV